MSDNNLTRRDLLRAISAAAVAGGFPLDAAQHVHQMATREKQDAGAYEPKLFQPHEYRTLDTLAELIMPGARKGGAKEFIDLLASANNELAAIFTGGLGWLDRQMHGEHAITFADASSERQTALLDRIAHTENIDETLEPGVRFFVWARKMVVDAYYTSEAGIAELGYIGNRGMTKFVIPKEAMEYALRRSRL